MKKNIAAEFIYDGLGFPVILLNVPLVNVRGIQIPNINYNVLQKNVLLALSHKLQPLTGNEIRFIRQYFEMTYTEFANRFGVTHPSVIHWEKAKDNFAKIQPATELCIRLTILDAIHAKDKLFREIFRNFNYSEFKSQKNQKVHQGITLDSNALI
jgi:DNA-binding transcriptional regulator YiaG